MFEINKYEERIRQALSHFTEELKRVRTGRAHPSMLDGVMVSAYGTLMPLNQLASVVAPEAQMLQITPFDLNNIQTIASAIRDNQSLGLNPSDDGRVVRVPIPPLTEERRKNITRIVSQKQEECIVVFRNIRHDALADIESMKKDKKLGEDEAKRLERQVDEMINKARSEAEAAAKLKEREIITL